MRRETHLAEEFVKVRRYDPRPAREQRSCGGTRILGIAEALHYPTEVLEDSKRVAGGGTERLRRSCHGVVPSGRVINSSSLTSSARRFFSTTLSMNMTN
jgi:hypothetical protein